MKKIAIITTSSEYADFHSNALKNLFKDDVEVSSYSYDNNTIDEVIDADLFLTSIPSLYHKSIRSIPKNSKVLVFKNTINNRQYEQIQKIPSGTTVLVVNTDFETTMETIVLFHDLGLDHLKYLPYFPGIESFHKTDVAITPGESEIVPDFVDKIIDIGHRVIDVDTLTEIAISLNLEHLLTQDYFIEYLKTIKIVNNSLISQLNKSNLLKNQILSLLNVVDDGIIIIDREGSIDIFNEKAFAILGGKSNLLNSKIKDIIPQIEFENVFKTLKESEPTIIKYSSKDLSIKTVPVTTYNEASSAVIIINDFNKKEQSQFILRSKLVGKNYNAKYTFDDILSCDNSFIQIKKLAEKQAKSDLSMIIYGESGTGKEMFAQAIHNACNRRNHPFTAVNCAALPENLLESELFGYEEGAFTGARKGGKPGYFELAHKGTIFLDEIGEINSIMQAKLLRVLEEREVTRVGGSNVIPVDIRIISATNKNLWHLVEEGKFRNDLYYRLNVLPLTLPPLRERPDDILLLFENQKNNIKAGFELSTEATEILKNYPWGGNIRELKNCVEYLNTLGKDIIAPYDLNNILRQKSPSAVMYPDLDNNLLSFFETIKLERENYKFILECLHSSYKNRTRIGRRSILSMSKDSDLFLSEAQIKKMLTVMQVYNLVKLSNGRGGTTITSLGIKALESLEKQYL
ncbi:Transcriptional regulator containing PAS, AAA-type ATPase, and DNA-binding Fis domains [Dethiosulfatibacter aminovorans DSM 17477]|uniref:Transcriptional regulator containing PAS, AAA-type ATPase, and DNA-binding Fis domains n=1 Tax=Dethiosulfatibacter aminovorans DSM 17477 TaxID=1121476 RepID=A0A1M6A8B2_9FIRM|nr:sigma 54-interacting transcriptional regulator [Dethiosulfatibacter aminovorans]SHI32687.1 Transcriptional regulator containing PAS, AAA-type ATPase, and DNA-binding Fis domains [Dethiosulfatibacter aminovorans DSM 17477]